MSEWINIIGEVIGWLHHNQLNEIMVVRADEVGGYPLSEAETQLPVYVLRWTGHDYAIINPDTKVVEDDEDVKIGSCIQFSTSYREQIEYAAFR